MLTFMIQAKKAVNYVVDKSSGEEDDDDDAAFNPTSMSKKRGRASKRRKTSLESDDDDIFVVNAEAGADVVDEGNFSNLMCPFRFIFADLT